MGKRSSATISTAQDKGTILIVDDMPENLKMLDNLLSAEGYNVRPSTSGILALNSVKHHLPDLVLLDINMPEMDGYEVCKQLKSDNMTVDIPVVFLSSADDINRRIKGLELGAVDYITKPFNTREILLRINTQLQFQESRKKLKKQNLYLEKMANLQQRRTQMICHDMKGLLTSILSFPKKIKELSSMNHRQDKLLTQIEKSGSKLLQMINRWNELAKLENGTYLFNPKPVDIIPLIDTIIFELQTSIEEKRVYFNTSLNKKPVDKEDTFHILGEELLSYSMLFNLIKNAIEPPCPDKPWEFPSPELTDKPSLFTMNCPFRRTLGVTFSISL